jgi:hypothetical protein
MIEEMDGLAAARVLLPEEAEASWEVIDRDLRRIGMDDIADALRERRAGSPYNMAALMDAVTAWAARSPRNQMTITIGQETECLATGASMTLAWLHSLPFVALLRVFEAVLRKQAGEGWEFSHG